MFDSLIRSAAQRGHLRVLMPELQVGQKYVTENVTDSGMGWFSVAFIY